MPRAKKQKVVKPWKPWVVSYEDNDSNEYNVGLFPDKKAAEKWVKANEPDPDDLDSDWWSITFTEIDLVPEGIKVTDPTIKTAVVLEEPIIELE